MKNFCLLLFLFAFTCSINAQRDDDEQPPLQISGNEGGDDLTNRILFEAGISNVHPWQLNAKLFNHAGYSQLYTVGFMFNFSDEPYTEDNDHYSGFDISWGMHWFLADQQVIRGVSADSMQYRLKGWEIMTSTLALNLIRNDHVDFVIGTGAYWGNLKLISKDLGTNEAGEYHNPFVAPMIRTELRFNFGSFSLGGRFSYRYDITKDRWKRASNNLEEMPGYRFREPQFMLYIGYRNVEYGY